MVVLVLNAPLADPLFDLYMRDVDCLLYTSSEKEDGDLRTWTHNGGGGKAAGAIRGECAGGGKEKECFCGFFRAVCGSSRGNPDCGSRNFRLFGESGEHLCHSGCDRAQCAAWNDPVCKGGEVAGESEGCLLYTSRCV